MKSLGRRRISYLLLSLITERDNLCIIVKDEHEKDAVESIIETLLYEIDTHKYKFRILRIPNVTVLTEEAYYEKWEDFSEYRLIFLEDSRLKWSLLDAFAKYVEETIKKHGSLEALCSSMVNIALVVDFACSSVDLKPLVVELEIKDKRKRKEYLERKKKAVERVFSFFVDRLADKRKAELAFGLSLYLAKNLMA